MSEEKSPDPISSILKPLTDITTAVAMIVAYIQGIFKVAETPIPNTLSLLLIVVTSVVVISRRWGKLNEKRKKTTSSASSKTTPKGPFLERLLEPIKESKRDPYLLPLPRRRMEAGFVVFLSVFTLGWTGFNLPSAITELTTDKEFVCSDYESEGKLRVVIADLDGVTPDAELDIPDRIAAELAEYPGGDFYTICRLYQPIKDGLEAPHVAQTREADMLIWGGIDVAAYDIHLEIPELGDSQKNLPNVSIEEATSTGFQSEEPKHISYVAQFALTELLLFDEQVTEAQIYLAKALDQAERDKLAPQYLADGYYLLGLYFDPDYSGAPNAERSIEGYTDALGFNENLHNARLNRGYGFMALGRYEEARADFDYLIEHDPIHKCDAYINRSELPGDPDATMDDLDEAVKCDAKLGYFFRGLEWMKRKDYTRAMRDLEKAVEYDPSGWHNYHYLGLAQLYGGEYEAALQSYKRMLPYLDQEGRDYVITELKDCEEVFPDSKATCEEIINALLAVELP